ncbi:bactericidal permeability-increasing protein isoform X1 [Conger conger]|uniref:bactericidal permeability-increasing protein isoform X1 n=1 Tax=Conger conger TaxID=82655 RepID=UPI002A5AE6EB|nr:bactericidal permeability-increasing protein isoform X1 [Conger conger]
MCQALLVLLALAGGAAAVEQPGVKAVLSEKGLQFATQVGTEWLQDYILRTPIPDISGDISLSLLGCVHYTLNSMSVSRLNLPLPSVGFSEGKGLQVGLSGLNMAVKGKWNTRYHIIRRDSGTFRLGLFNMGVALLLQVGSDDQGHPTISSLQCDASIESTDILFHGGASWILQLFVESFKGQIHAKVQQMICPGIERNIQVLERYLQAMNVSFQVNSDLLLDLPLTSPPVIEASDISVDLKGEFYSTHTHAEPPFAAGPLELPPQDRFMLLLGVSEFCLNSASFAYLSAGQLQMNITNNTFPGFPFNTTSFGKFIPQLPEKFPDMLMLFHVYASDAPTVSFLPDNATARLSASAKAYAIRPDQSLAPLFRLDLSADFSGRFLVKDGKLHGSLMLNNLSLAVGATEVGPFETGPLQNVLVVATRMMLQKVNANLTAGICIPAIPGTQWSNTVLKVNKGFVAIATDAAVSSLGGQEH